MSHRSTRGARWLLDELPRLVREAVLDEAAAERLRAHYAPALAVSRRRVALAVFATLGAVLVGGGVILLLAHNWDDLGRAARAGICFLLLLAAQALAGWVLVRRAGSEPFREGAASFLFAAVGTALALIDQTYQMPGGLGDLLLTWMLLGLPLAYLLRARMPIVLYWVGITVWLFEAPFSPAESLRVFGYLALAALAVPYLVSLARSEPERTLPFWMAALSVAITTPYVASDVRGGLWPLYLTGAYAVLHGAAAFGRGAWRRPLRNMGALGCAVSMLVLAWSSAWQSLTPDYGARSAPAAIGVAIAILCSFAVAAAARDVARGAIDRALFSALPLPVGLCTVVATFDDAVVPVLVMTLYGLACGLLLFRAGLRTGAVGKSNAGLLLVTAVLAQRFFDADFTFVERGLAFIVLGAVFLGVNVWMVRRSREMGR